MTTPPPHPGLRSGARRAAVGIASVIALVFLQLLVVGAIIAGTRGQDLTMQRLNSTRSQYSADAVIEMSVRELCLGTDEDGDGAVGSIGGGIPANGRTISGAQSAAALNVAGQVYTITAKGTQGVCTRAVSMLLTAAASSVDPFAVYETSGTPTAPVVRVHSSGAWSSALNTGALSTTVAWALARNSPVSPSTPTRALIAVDQSRGLYLSRYSSGAWGAAANLTSNCGTTSTRVFGADFEGKTGNLMTVYRKTTNSTLYYRTYTVASPSEQSFSIGLSSAPDWIELAAKSGSNEMVVVAASGNRLYAGVWNGSSWGNTTSLEASLKTTGRPFHVVYTTKTGKALVVWSATTGAPKYATWDGSSWTASTVPGISGGVPAGWIELEPNPLKSSDEVLMACIGTNDDLNVNNWTGSAWGTNTVVETAMASHTQPRVDIAYQPDGARAMLVWHKQGQTAVRYRTWASGAWTALQTGPDMTTTSGSIQLARGYGTDEVMMLVRRASSTSYADYNAASNSGSISLGTVNITGPISAGAGSYLPTPPSATANSTNISPSSGTVTPGTYGTMSQSGTVTFTAGTYVFSSVTVGGTLLFDTSAGPVTWIITTGGLSGNNNNTFTNTGSGPVQVNILNGDFDLKNNSAFTNVDIFVYNGSIQMKNNTDGSVGLYASGTIDIKNNGTITLNEYSTYSASPNSACSAVLWTNGVAGSRTDLNSSCTPAIGIAEPFGLAPSPLPQSTEITSWAAVSP